MIPSLQGRRLLVVEDEPLVAMLLETILEEMGCEVLGPFSTPQSALDALRDGPRPDAALLDVNVSGEEVFPVAEAAKGLGALVIFCTGYGEGALTEPWRGSPILQKPFTEATVHETLSGLFAA